MVKGKTENLIVRGVRVDAKRRNGVRPLDPVVKNQIEETVLEELRLSWPRTPPFRAQDREPAMAQLRELIRASDIAERLMRAREGEEVELQISLVPPAKRSRFARAAMLLRGPEGRGPKIELAPGTGICRFFRKILPARAVQEFIEPHFGDLQERYFHALAQKDFSEARKLKVYYYSRFVVVALAAAFSALSKAFRAG